MDAKVDELFDKLNKTNAHYSERDSVSTVSAFLKENPDTDINAENRYGIRLLEYAIFSRHEKLCKFLVEHGADVNLRLKGWSGNTTPLQFAYREYLYKTVELFIEHGADVNACDSFMGNTVIMDAVERDDLSLCDKLLKAGADVYKANAFCDNALTLAVERNSHKMLSLLKSHGANFNARSVRKSDDTGEEVWTYPLLELNYSPKVVKYSSKTLRKLINWGVDVSCVDSKGNTPLTLASEHGNHRLCEMLLHAGACIGEKPNDFLEKWRLLDKGVAGRLLKCVSDTVLNECRIPPERPDFKATVERMFIRLYTVVGSCTDREAQRVFALVFDKADDK